MPRLRQNWRLLKGTAGKGKENETGCKGSDDIRNSQKLGKAIQAGG